ncbi:MAG: DUF3080 family protein, partial [Gammaproteobacteria bacterium]|nr:DUF3080 family protein [Gammaproteobacteria bacterium]
MSRRIWLLAIFLVGCDWTDNSFAPDQDDLDRIASILGEESIALPPPLAIESQTPELGLSETRISIGDALELGECGLLPLIAERNSSLGRQKQESTRLIYEWTLKSGLDQCSQLNQEEWFQKARIAKTRDVEIAVIKLLMRSEEADRIHSKINKPFASLDESRMAYLNRTQPIVQVITQALQQSPPPSNTTITQFEDSLRAWSQTQHHGTLHQAIIEAQIWLQKANTLQSQALKANRLCPMGTPTEAGRNLQLFIRNYFGGTIQPKLSSITRALDELGSTWSTLPITLWSGDTLIDALLKVPPRYRDEF